MSLYELTAKRNNGRNQQLEAYKGKVLLIVNTASECGFTPQYKGLQELYAKYKDRGFAVLGFPCDQFGAPGAGQRQRDQVVLRDELRRELPAVRQD